MKFFVKTIELDIDASDLPMVKVALFNQEHVGRKKEDAIAWAQTVVELFASGEVEVVAPEQERE